MKVKLDVGAYAPVKAYDGDFGWDLRSPGVYTIPARGSVVIDTGVHVIVPYGQACMIKSKSGLNVKYGLLSEGVIDYGYQGSIRVKLYNMNDKDYLIQQGQKITQIGMVHIDPKCDVEIVDEMPASERGTGGFGSTGR